MQRSQMRASSIQQQSVARPSGQSDALESRYDPHVRSSSYSGAQGSPFLGYQDPIPEAIHDYDQEYDEEQQYYGQLGQSGEDRYVRTSEQSPTSGHGASRGPVNDYTHQEETVWSPGQTPG